jgi:hypothetical protein
MMVGRLDLALLLFPWLGRGAAALQALRIGFVVLLGVALVLGHCAPYKSVIALQMLFATLGAVAARGLGRLPRTPAVLLVGVLAFPWVAMVVGCGAFLAGLARFAYARELGALAQPDLLVALAVWPAMVYAALRLRG